MSEIQQTHSKDLLDVGKAGHDDPLLIRKKKPYRMPPSSVLGQVKSFLPKMQEANSQLEERLKTAAPEDLDIENITDCENEVIEMNLAVFAEDDNSSSDDDDNDDYDSDIQDGSSDEALPSCGEVTAANIKLPNNTSCRPKRTIIEDLSRVKDNDLRSGVKPDSDKETTVPAEDTSGQKQDVVADKEIGQSQTFDMNR
ncbi:uncharacterized protein LOC119738190 [Patiria miniata]|uniref:Uncharacterized protein n=1 Tax=Patiria miniata TaxID=46514 RepID=A0A914AYY1_PATMI|nr:uncharacterized protein LOC119738190 [Patiria miniata]